VALEEGMSGAGPAAPPKVSPLYDPRWRSAAFQIVLCLVIVWLAYSAITNAAENLARARIASGFDFWNRTAGFDISQTLIPYTTISTYGRAFWVGLVNTLLVSALGIVFATAIGFAVGVLQLSKNVLIAKLARGYVELVRNLPLLLQLLFWYNAVLKALPNFHDSVSIPGGALLNNRGLFLPKPVFGAGFEAVPITLALGLIGAFLYYRFARRRQMRTGRQAPVLWVSLALILGLPLVALAAAGFPVTFDLPEMGRFNIRGGIEILPEFAALLFGLSIYTAAFIAEAVRAGIQAVSQGQTEAAYSLGLRPGPTLRLIVIPQAMRVIVPPLTNQYLNLTKNSSLAVAVGYPDLVQVFTGTVLNQTGQAVEVVAITMAVYLAISLVTSGLMNLYNRHIALVER
jgi:general L-amino acid transport system permease protein